MGRPRKPIEDHIAAGTYRRDRHGPLTIPIRLSGGRPPMPRGFNQAEKAAWRTLTHELETLGLLHTLDAPLLELAACQWARAREARSLVRRHGLLVVGARGGLIANPAIRIERDASRLLARLAGDLGLSSTTRAKLGLGSEPPLGPTGDRLGPSPRLRAVPSKDDA